LYCQIKILNMKYEISTTVETGAQVFDATVKNVVRLFEGASSFVNTAKLTNVGKEYKICSLLKEMSIDKFVTLDDIKRVSRVVYDTEDKVDFILNNFIKKTS
jgi:hypothetical protein